MSKPAGQLVEAGLAQTGVDRHFAGIRLVGSVWSARTDVGEHGGQATDAASSLQVLVGGSLSSVEHVDERRRRWS